MPTRQIASSPGRLAAALLVALTAAAVLSCRSGNSNTGGSASSGAATVAAKATGTGSSKEPLLASDVGVTPTEVVVGNATPLTGNQASYKPVADGIKAYFDYVNDQGGVNGRKIRLVVKDSGYDPAKAVSVTRELVETDKVFAVLGTIGTSVNSATYDYLNTQKVPDMYLSTGAAKWNDFEGHPYVFGFLFGYPQEAEVFWKYIQQNLSGKKIGVLYQNDGFGRDYEKRFKELAGTSVVREESYEATATDVTSQMTALKNSGAEILVQFTTPKFAVQATKFIYDSGWKATNIMTYVSADPSVVEGAGTQAIEGTISGTFTPLLTDDNDPRVKAFKDIMQKYAPGAWPSTFALWGFAEAQLFVETLKRAGRNPTRASLIKAAEGIRDFKDLAALGPATMTPHDHAPMHCERLIRYMGGRAQYATDLLCAAVKE